MRELLSWNGNALIVGVVVSCMTAGAAEPQTRAAGQPPDKTAVGERHTSEAEDAKLRELDRRIEALHKSLAAAQQKARGLAPGAAKASAAPEFRAAWDAWYQAAAALESAIDDDKSEDQVRALRAAEAAAAKGRDQQRARVYGDLDAELTAVEERATELGTAGTERGEILARQKADSALAAVDAQWNALVEAHNARLAQGLAAVQKVWADEQIKEEKAARELKAVEDEFAERFKAAGDDTARKAVEEAMKARLTSARNRMAEVGKAAAAAEAAADQSQKSAQEESSKVAAKVASELSAKRVRLRADQASQRAASRQAAETLQADARGLRSELLDAEADHRSIEQKFQARLEEARPFDGNLARRKLPEVRFNGVHLADAVGFYRDACGLNLYVDWRSLQVAGVTSGTPITYKAVDVFQVDAIKTSIGSAEDKEGKKPVQFWDKGHVLVITTAEGRKAWEQQIARLHEVRHDSAARELLDAKMPELSLTENHLTDVLDFYRDVTGIKLEIDWTALKAAGAARTSPVSLKVRDIPRGEALLLILFSAGAGSDAAVTFDGKTKTLRVGKAVP